ncbi:class I SAM-dependent methyltransferase [Arsenicicoccus sp. oral taxon 190]|uniref:class I SAM-dependent methyltransferase n=1 Tax=Arsenicicoccus sp. oral taxon 190 TaxID=1658671 RepID=UPI000679FB6C|nr:methyltransferase [Arsenicicoccus sp. oral taxon 190]AKT52187.1 16S rRNA methyltransferase [Arsenicicoccus sp. oral taxon 190]
MSQSHYFTSAAPAGDDERRSVRIRLAGRTVDVETAPGTFSPDGLDKGTAVLLAEAPAPPATGTFLDLGCGWGPIALTLALTSPDAVVDAVDVNERSLDLTRRNAAALGLTGIRATTPEGLAAGTAYDLIWSNPPIRVGKQVLHELLRTWLPRLAPTGHAYLVVQKNLGSDSLQTWIARELGPQLVVERFTSAKGFRVLHVCREAGQGEVSGSR